MAEIKASFLTNHDENKILKAGESLLVDGIVWAGDFVVYLWQKSAASQVSRNILGKGKTIKHCEQDSLQFNRVQGFCLYFCLHLEA